VSSVFLMFHAGVALEQQQHNANSALDALHFTAGRLHLSKSNALMCSWNSGGCLNFSCLAL
jgi:hypothetical protein